MLSCFLLIANSAQADVVIGNGASEIIATAAIKDINCQNYTIAAGGTLNTSAGGILREVTSFTNNGIWNAGTGQILELGRWVNNGTVSAPLPTQPASLLFTTLCGPISVAGTSDTDGDGISDVDEGDNAVALGLSLDVDNDGIYNFLDNDSDGDGILDVDEPNDNDANNIPDFLEIKILYDYGDAPISGTAPDGSSTISYGEAKHAIDNTLYLGTLPDAETANQPSANADGDDNNGSDDEAGITTFAILTAGDSSYSLSSANISIAGTGTLHAWIDFNGDGNFASTEYANTTVTAGSLANALSWTGQSTMNAGTTFARFRFTTDTSVTANTPSGMASDGEVEDYAVTVITIPASNGGQPSPDTDGDGIPDGDDPDDDNDGILDSTEKACSSLMPLDLSGVTNGNPQITTRALSAIAGAGTFSANITANYNSTVALRPQGLADGDLRLGNNINTETSEYEIIFALPTDITLSQANNSGAFEEQETWTITTAGGTLAVSNPVINVTTESGTAFNDTELRNVTGNNSNQVSFSPNQANGIGHIATTDSQWKLEAKDVTKLTLNMQSNTFGGNFARLRISVPCIPLDSDGDGLANHLDLDADNDGIPDNIEAQTTQNYSVPNNDAASHNGVDSAYSSGLTPVNTDGTDEVDYLDTDSDNDTIFDIIESGQGLSDTDNDGRTNDPVGMNGLDNKVAAELTDDYSDVNGKAHDGTNFTLNDSDNDTAANGNDATPLSRDLDYRDVPELGSSCEAVEVTTLGNATVTANNEYILTQDVNNQSGFIWSNKKIDLNQSFDIELGVYLGSNVGIGGNGLDSGADGLAFILQNDPRGTAAQGMIGGGMGVDGALNLSAFGVTDQAISPSITIEFDTFDNTPFSSTGDIAADHTGIYLNGDVYIPDGVNTLLAATSVGIGGEIEDGKYHLTRYVWNPTTQLLTYYFDGQQLASITYDLITYFGSQYVTFGFSAATGASKNLHKACWIKAPALVTPPIIKDFGDAPITGTAPNGSDSNNYGEASHTITSGVYLGSADPDADAANQPTANANGDDNDGTNDDDGVDITSVILTQNQSTTVTAKVTGGGGYLQGWIDFNGDGDFADAGEQIATNLQDNGTNGDVAANDGKIEISVAVPINAITNQTFARFRWSTTQNLNSTIAANDGEVEDYALTIQIGGFSVTGRVYKDTNIDRVNNTSEIGISGLPVVLVKIAANPANNSCVSTKTDAKGNYSFASILPGEYQLYEASRETIPSPKNCDISKAKDPASYRSTTANVLPVFNVLNAAITGKDFGDINDPLFSPDHSGTVLAGNVVFYTHTFTPKSTGSVTFNNTNSTPATTGWANQLYQDTNCNNKLDGVEANTPIGNNIATTAGINICLINKVYAPSNVVNAETFNNVIEATFDFNANALAGSVVLKVTDVSKASAKKPPITEGNSRLILRKTVENITQGTAETETQNQAKPSDVLKYRLYYRNTGTGVLTDLIINDEVPAFSTLNGSPVCGMPLPASLTSCTPSVNNDAIKWSFPSSDTLQGGSGGVVSYEVMID